MISASPTSALIASVISRKSEISYDGAPSGLRAWMCTWTPPSSTMRRASAAYSSGVYGIAGHWSRLASDPEIEQVMTTGSSRLKAAPSAGSGKCYFPHHRGGRAKPLLLDLTADLAGRVLLGVDVHVRLAGLDRLDRGGEARHAGRLGELLRGQLAALRQLAGLRADVDDHRARLARLAGVDVRRLRRAGQGGRLQRVGDRLVLRGDGEDRRAGRLRVALRRLGLAVQRRSILRRREGGNDGDGQDCGQYEDQDLAHVTTSKG